MSAHRMATFSPFIDQTFVVRLGDERTVPLKLTSITSNESGGQYESFSLNFDPLDAGAAVLPDGSYLMEHERLGKTVIFISPTPDGGPKPGRYYYEAVFNVYIGAENQ